MTSRNCYIWPFEFLGIIFCVIGILFLMFKIKTIKRKITNGFGLFLFFIGLFIIAFSEIYLSTCPP